MNCFHIFFIILAVVEVVRVSFPLDLEEVEVVLSGHLLCVMYHWPTVDLPKGIAVVVGYLLGTSIFRLILFEAQQPYLLWHSMILYFHEV
jgi:hypothetical protein